MPGFEWIDEKEKESVLEVLDKGFIFRYNFDGARHDVWKAKELENKISKKMNVGYAHVVSSGTAALTCAFNSIGIGEGDEVIVAPFTFVASIEAILLAGAIPVYANIDKSLCLNVDEIKKVITPKTKAINLVHMCGSMGDIDAISALAKEHNLLLVEDACQAIGGSYKGKKLGTIGDIGTYSFDSVKTITCGEGGAIVTNNEDFYEYAHKYSDHGHDHIGADRGAESHPLIGYNFRMSELNAALGVAQIDKLDDIISTQKKNKSILKESVKKANNKIIFRKLYDEDGDNGSFLCFFMPSAKETEDTVKALGENKIPCAYWYNNNWHYIKKWEHFDNLASKSKLSSPLYENNKKYNSLDLKVSDDIMSCLITIPIFLKYENIEDVANKLANILS